jgi:hypothetical protein
MTSTNRKGVIPLPPDMDNFDVRLLSQALDDVIIDRGWLHVLETFVHLGLVDMIQLQQTTGLDRERLRSLLKRMEKCAAGGPPILTELNQTARRAGVRGRAPQIYRLEPAGAALLQMHGWPDVHPSGRSDESEIMHAVCVLDVRLAAQQAGMKVETERTRSYDGSKSIRPDNLVSLADGTLAIFETEQQADPSLLRRVSESLQNKLAYFKSAEGGAVSPIVRMIVNAAPGPEFFKTLKVWRRVYGMLLHAGEVPFRLVAMPLAEFRELPDWSEDVSDKRWVEVRPLDPNPRPQTAGEGSNKTLVAATPKALIYRTTHDNRLTIEALWQWFQEQAGAQRSKYPRPDPEFFEVMQIIYAASHDRQTSPLEQAGMPWASLYLLERYLEMQPELRRTINQAISRGGTAMRWNPTTILHRMQVVIDAFLSYHGWRSSGPLTVISSVSWANDEPHAFGVTVRISNWELLMAEGNTLVPAESEKLAVERSLAWVLYALFAYSPHLHVTTAPFW